MKKTFIPLFVGLLCWTGAQAAIINHAYDGSKTAAENGDALKTTISGASSGDVIKVQAGTDGTRALRHRPTTQRSWMLITAVVR